MTTKKKKSVTKSKLEEFESDPNWFRPDAYDPDEMPEITEETFVYVTGYPPKTGRPPKKLMLFTSFNLASIGCTEYEIGAAMGLFKDAMTRAKKNNPVLEPLLQAGRQKGNASLRKRQFSLAMAGSERMLIWLGTDRLKQSNTPEPDPELENPQPLAITFEVKPAVEPIQTTNANTSS